MTLRHLNGKTPYRKTPKWIQTTLTKEVHNNLSNNFTEAISILVTIYFTCLKDRESSGRFTCNEYKIKILEDNTKLKSTRKLKCKLNTLVLAQSSQHEFC